MKKWLISSLVVVALMIVAAGVFAQVQDKNKEKANTECKAFVDQNSDGVCDNHATPNCTHSEGCKSKHETGSEGAACQGKEAEGCAAKCKQKESGCCSKKDTTAVAPAK